MEEDWKMNIKVRRCRKFHYKKSFYKNHARIAVLKFRHYTKILDIFFDQIKHEKSKIQRQIKSV